MNNHEQALKQDTKPGSAAELALIQAALNRHYPYPNIDQSQAFEAGWAECRTALQPTEQPEPYIEGGRESVDDALEIVESFGSDIRGVNDTFARQIILATEVKRLRVLYESAVGGRSTFRNAFRKARDAIIPPLDCPACGLTHDKKDCPSTNSEPPVQPEAAQDERVYGTASEGERGKFEKWYASLFASNHVANMPRRSNGEYVKPQAQIAWEAWQAAKRDAAQAQERELHDRIAKALDLHPGIVNGKRTVFAWDYLIGLIEDLQKTVDADGDALQPDALTQARELTDAPTCRVDYTRANFTPFYLLANARAIVSREWRNKENWVLAMRLFAVGSNTARAICQEANIDPDAKEVRALLSASKEK